jgi:hypothetical protein
MPDVLTDLGYCVLKAARVTKAVTLASMAIPKGNRTGILGRRE